MQARNFTTNVPKILDLKSFSEQIFSEDWRWVPLTEEDHRFISERLPALIAAESKPAKQEEKEKHKKIAKIKAGDPKDMTVILLREVLME